VPHTTVTYNEYMTMIDESEISFTEGRKGMTKDIGEEGSLKILHPEDPDGDHLNNASVVAKIILDELEVLFTGTEIYRTDKHDHIVIKSDGEEYIVKTKLN